jgi:glycerophosphoryl diester phosphodiesterase
MWPLGVVHKAHHAAWGVLLHAAAEGVAGTRHLVSRQEVDRHVVSPQHAERAHKPGLAVHTWAFRDDASGYGFEDPKTEMQAYMKFGLDGFFTDSPATGVAARAALP